ncbi:hypothetical protein BOTBODRAFT_36062 [Botryobasidium botryosum FD-172 SS1]|uniref:Phosphodiest-domain-containing protein n=1 Tax=Botryobasidium botryosum (strain FD-172 SS1) TaxID=930990 RepID=A0A067MF80_BOTB1|nr:hypothetical protein BOTBODRAFT_36062 [Botryobasidium botryosum FD-172 SS1]
MAPPVRLPRSNSEEELLITSPPSRSNSPAHTDKELEQQLLLSKSEEINDSVSRKKRRTAWKLAVGIGSTVLLLAAATFVTSGAAEGFSNWMCGQKPASAELTTLSNGTHAYKKTVLVISIDGFQADYIDRELTPNLVQISKKGLRAKWMKPRFPTLTFPNHWAMMTGLNVESHGIVANTFYDPVVGATFEYTDPKRSWDANWWYGEPMWATAGKAGLITANLMWPGPPVTKEGISPTYYVPFKDKVPMKNKAMQIMEWLELPIDQRPQLINVYEPSLDQAGHKYGPDSPEVDLVLDDVDAFARDIYDGIAARNLSDVVDVIFVSDHGMTDTSHVRLVFLDDILGPDGVSEVEHEDGWPSVGLRLSPKANVTLIKSRLLEAQRSMPHAFDVYDSETMPERYHFRESVAPNGRIAPIYMVPKLGWSITNHHEFEVLMGGSYEPIGSHGYDNEEVSMRAMFVAHGPFSSQIKDQSYARRAEKHTLDAPFVMEGFDNTELYGLVMKLLGIQGAPHNGTVGFWENYLD